MNEEEIVRRIAACGLDCGRCVSFAEGPVKRLSGELLAGLAGFERRAAAMAETVPELDRYDEFAAVLEFFARAACGGCREGGADCFPGCAARTCVQERGIAFCHQCAEFPCGRNAYPPSLAERWKRNNLRLHEVGLQRYFQEQLEKPRYAS